MLEQSVLSAVLALVLASPVDAGRGSVSDLSVRGACEALRPAGRARCELEFEAPDSLELTWADALVVAAPPFARPLRARVPAVVQSEHSARATLALVASPGRGVGKLRIAARAVLCDGERRCRAVRRDLDIALQAPTRDDPRTVP